MIDRLVSMLVSVYRNIPIIRELIQIRQLLAKMTNMQQLSSDLQKSSYLIQFSQFHELELMSTPRFSDPKRLLCFAYQVCSQHGEDGMIAEIFKRIGVKDKTFVEIGVGDGIENNTAFLLTMGWSGYWIDADKAFEDNVRQSNLDPNQLRWSISLVTKENIDAILTGLDAPTEFDLLSLDVDQNTYYIWEGMLRFRPRVIVIEYNAALPPDLEWKVRYDPNRTWDKATNYGASLKAFELLGKHWGYSLVGCEVSGTNAFFVRNDLVEEGKFCAPFSSENHYEPRRFALSFSTGHLPAILDPARSL